MAQRYDQKIDKIEIKELKGVMDATIEFVNPLTAIVGPNCSGKTTLLNALSCVYQDSKAFGDYFIPNEYCDWSDSEFKVFFSYREKNERQKLWRKYWKGPDRWQPVNKRRPEREVYYFRISDEIPSYEKEWRKDPLYFYDLNENGIDNEANLIDRGKAILFQDYNSVKAVNFDEDKELLSVGNGKKKYLSLDMGAGEQKIFKYLMFLKKIEKGSLVLIDEIDIFIHSRSFKMFIEELIRIATSRNLQIIFSTHSEMIMQFSDSIDIKYLFKTKDKTLVLDKPNSDIIYRLSGEHKKEFDIYVEDSLSESIVRELAGELGIRRMVSICCFGAASNCFTLAAGLKLKAYKNFDKSLFVVDGDEYKSHKEKEDYIKKILTGNTEIAKRQRIEVLNSITQYNLPTGKKPEEYIAEIFLSIDSDSEDIIEIKCAISENMTCLDKHDIINRSLEELNYEKKVGYAKIINLIKQEENYCNLVKDVKKNLKDLMCLSI